MRHTKMLPDTEKALIEMLVFTPLCVHENPQTVLIIGGELLPQEATKIGKNITEIKEISTLSDIKNQKFDIVISFFDSIVYQDLVPYLHKDAILSCKAKSNEIKKELENAGKEFRIAMPFFDFECIFASNKYHPTADLSLQKSDFIEESSYYNSEIHTASFMLHAHAKRELLGVCKN